MAFVRLPNGSDFPILEGESPQDALIAAMRKYPEAFGLSPAEPKEDTSGFTAAMSASGKRMAGEAALTAGKLGIMGLPEAEKYQKEQEAAAAQRFTPTQDDWTTSPFLKFKELAGGSAPYMVAPLVAGAAAASLPVSAPTAAVLGALGAGAVSTGQFTGSNIKAQMETGKTLEETDLGKAALAAIPQAALDTLSMRMVPGLGKLLGAAGKEVTEAGAKELANQTLKQIAWDYTKATGTAMTHEGLTEAAQQVLERAQAGLSITDADARKDYLENFQGGAALAFALGPFGRALDRGSIKSQGKALEAKRLGEERTIAEAKQAEVDAAAAAEKQKPEYLQKLNAQYQALEQEKQALPKIEKPKKIKDASAEQEIAYEDALKTYEESVAAKKDFIERYKPVKQEYKDRFNDIQALQVEDQTQEAMQGGAGPMAQPTLPGFDLGGQQPGAAEQLAAEQDRALYGAEAKRESARQAFGEELAPTTGAEALPEQPSTLTPVQQRVGLMQQRDTLQATQNQLQARIADVNTAPQERVALGRQATQITTALNDITAQLPTLDKLQKQESTLTTQLAKATKAKALPQAQAISARLQAVQQQIAGLSPAPTMEGQGALDLRPPVAEKPLPKAKTERVGQKVLPGFQPQGVQATAPATETATAEDLTDDIRRLELLAKRQYEKVAASTLETFPTENKKAEAIRARIQELEQQQESAPKKVPSATEADVAAREENIRTLEEGVAKAEKDFYEAKDDKGDFAQATKFRNSWSRLTEKLKAARAEPVPQVQPALAEQNTVETVPQATAPQATAPQATAPQATAPQTTKPTPAVETAPQLQPVERAKTAKAAEIAKVAEAAPKKTSPSVEKRNAAKQAAEEKQAAAQQAVEEKKAAAQRALEERKPKARRRGGEKSLAAFVSNLPALGKSWALKEFSKQPYGNTRVQLAEYSRKSLKEDIAALKKHPYINPFDQAEKLHEMESQIVSIEQALPELEALDIADYNKEINNLVLRTARQELDAAVKSGTVTKEESVKIAEAAGKTGNAFSADALITDVLDKRTEKAERAVSEKKAVPQLSAPKAATKAEPKAAPKAAPKAKTKADEVAKAEAETKKLAQEQPDLFDDANFDSDTDTASDTALREDATFYDGRPTTDLSEAARDAAQDGNVTDLLTELTKSKNALHREIATRLQTLMSGLGRRPKIVVADNLMDNGKRVEGYYTASKNRITVDSESLTEETVIHELVHAVTLGVLRADPSTLSTEQRAARADLERIFNKIKTDPTFAKEYGTVNLEEFAAEVLTNSQLRDKLNQQKSDGKSILQSIYQALMRLIGLDPDSMAAEAVQATFKLFQPPSTAIKDSVAIPSVMRGVFPGTKAVAAANMDKGAADTVNALVGRAATAGDKITASALGLRMRTMIADKWAPVEELLKLGISKGEVKMAQAMQLRFLMRVSEDTTRLVSAAINDAVPQFVRGADGVITLQSTGKGPNAKQIAQALSGSKLGNAQFVENFFTSWLAILRAEKDGIGYDKLNYGNDKEGNPILNAEKARAIKTAVESDPATKKAFAEARELYQQYNKDLLNMLVQSGYMSQEKANELLKGDYVPYYRIRGGIVELYVGGSKKVTIGSVIDQPQLKELVGGEDKILPIFSGMVQNTSLLMRSAVRNMQMRDVGNVLQDMGLAKIVKGEGPRDVYTARFRKNGTDYYVRLDESAFPGNIPAEVVIMGLQGIKTAIPTTVRLMGMPVNLLRKGITRMPTYALRQLVRDPVHAWITTGGDFSVVTDAYKQFFKSLKETTPTELSLQRAGAISSNVQHLGSQEDVAGMLRDLTGGKSGWNFNGILAKLDTLGMKADAATRAAVYNNYRKKGLSHTEAVLGTAESMNFSRRGTSASLHWLSTMIPFFNAQIQGLDAVYRSATGNTVFEEKMGAQAKLLKRGALMFGMSFAYAAMMQDDDAYKNATTSERAQYWFVHIPGVKEPLRVPIPFEPGIAFKVVPELIFNTAFGDTKARDALDAMRKQLIQAQPLGIPTALKPLAELATNYNFYTESPLISHHEQMLTTDKQIRANTTEIAKLLGKTGAISPISVDHLIRSYTGGLGMLLTQMSDYALRPLSGSAETSAPTKTLSQMPVFGSLFQPTTGRGVLDAAYTDVAQFQKAAMTYQDMIKSGRGAEAAEFANKNARDIALSSTGGAFRQKMGELAALKRQIMAMPNMSGDEKRTQIDNIRKVEIQLATMIRQLSSAP